MLMKNEFSLDFCQQNLLPVQFSNFLGRPSVIEEIELLLDIYYVHLTTLQRFRGLLLSTAFIPSPLRSSTTAAVVGPVVSQRLADFCLDPGLEFLLGSEQLLHLTDDSAEITPFLELGDNPLELSLAGTNPIDRFLEFLEGRLGVTGSDRQLLEPGEGLRCFIA